ncbi:MAG: hypothetical protein HFK03_03325 [Clostridia bacterium]|mgnify:CR=1 FL=1|jgi:hypothetical protein|nr:hypothetical protein [Clostridia bacterium]
MINDNKNNLDEIKISKLLFNEIINALKTMFKKVALREVELSIIYGIVYQIEKMTFQCDTLLPEELDPIEHLRLFYYILDGCIYDDSCYKKEYLNYKESI